MLADWAFSRSIRSCRRSNADRSPGPGDRTSRVSAAGEDISRSALTEGSMLTPGKPRTAVAILGGRYAAVGGPAGGKLPREGAQVPAGNLASDCCRYRA